MACVRVAEGHSIVRGGLFSDLVDLFQFRAISDWSPAPVYGILVHYRALLLFS